jgi:hypothetical protein
MCATRMKRDGELRRDTVVGTVMSNLGLERALEAQGIAFVRTPVGDRYVVEAMRKGGFNLGGEQSGHVIFLDHASTGDGLIAALQVLAIVIRTGRPLSALAEEAMERVPQVLESVILPARRPLEDMAALQVLIAQAKTTLGRDGRVLVREGTEPKLRVMVEGPTRDGPGRSPRTRSPPPGDVYPSTHGLPGAGSEHDPPPRGFPCPGTSRYAGSSFREGGPDVLPKSTCVGGGGHPGRRRGASRPPTWRRLGASASGRAAVAPSRLG